MVIKNIAMNIEMLLQPFYAYIESTKYYNFAIEYFVMAITLHCYGQYITLLWPIHDFTS